MVFGVATRYSWRGMCRQIRTFLRVARLLLGKGFMGWGTKGVEVRQLSVWDSSKVFQDINCDE